MDPKTEEEKLRTEIFIPKEEHTSLERNYRIVMDKNSKYRENECLSERQIVELRAEIDRLGSKDAKSVQELGNANAEATKLKARVLELENLCRKQAEQFQAVENHFHRYFKGVGDLSQEYFTAQNELAGSGSSPRITRSDDGEIYPTGTSRSGEGMSLLSMPRDPLPTVPQQFHNQSRQPTLPQATPSQQSLSTATNARPSLRGRGETPAETTGKRALLPGAKLDDLAAKRRKEEHSQKSIDPRLQKRQA